MTVRSLFLVAVSWLTLNVSVRAGEPDDLRPIDQLLAVRPADAASAAKRDDELVHRCRTFLDRYPDSAERPRVTFELGQALFRMEHHDEAEPVFRAFLEAWPDDPRYAAMALLMHAYALHPLERFEEAEAECSRLLDRKDVAEDLRAHAMYALGRSQLGRGAYADGKATFRRLQAEAPGHDLAQGVETDLQELAILGEKAPDLPGLQGGPAIVHFFRAASAKLSDHLDFVRTLSLAAGPGVPVIGIILDREKPDAPLDVPGKVLWDGKGWKSPWVQAYKTPVLPRTLLIDRNGRIREIGVHEHRLTGAATLLSKEERGADER